MVMPTGVTSSLRKPLGANVTVSFTTLAFASSTVTEAPSSLVTHTSLPSGVSAKRRGRLPTTTLARIALLAVSIT